MLLLSVILIPLIYFIYKLTKFHLILAKVPSPNGASLISFFRVISDTEHMFDLFRKYSQDYYPIYRLSALFIAVVALLDPSDVELVLASTKHMQKSQIYSFLMPWLGTGLLTSTGKKWQTRRKILTPAFHFNILQKYVQVFNEETHKLIEVLSAQGEIINLIPAISQFTLNSISETAMGLNDIDQNQQKRYKDAVYEMGKILLKRISYPLYLLKPIYNLSNLAKIERSIVKILHDFSYSIIDKRQREENFENRRLLDILLKAKAEGENIDDEGIREEVDTFMFEGHDTTAMAISFILFTLAKQKQVQDKILEEIAAVMGESKCPTYNELQQLKYMERCIKECLRLYPSVPFITRIAGETFTTTTGYTIPQGTILHLHIFDIHRNPKIFSEPLVFNPDRFLPTTTEEQRHPFAFIPFSAGSRNCIGQKFALLEIKAVLCGILKRFVLHDIDCDVGFYPDLVLRPKSDIKIRISHRSLGI